MSESEKICDDFLAGKISREEMTVKLSELAIGRVLTQEEKDSLLNTAMDGEALRRGQKNV